LRGEVEEEAGSRIKSGMTIGHDVRSPPILVIASAAKQSSSDSAGLDGFAALAMTISKNGS
jgi:hypothetical protein